MEKAYKVNSRQIRTLSKCVKESELWRKKFCVKKIEKGNRGTKKVLNRNFGNDSIYQTQ